jgi:hypothetical protein
MAHVVVQPRAAITAISTRRLGEASFASTVARAGVLPWGTHASQAAFICAKVAMSRSQMLADRMRVLSVPASASRASILPRICFVWPPTSALGSSAAALDAFDRHAGVYPLCDQPNL